MLEYNSIDVSEGIDVNKCDETSKKWSLCQYYYFLNKNFNYQKHLCYGCHSVIVVVSVKAINMSNVAIIYHGGNAYRVNYIFMSRNDVFNLIKNSNILDKKGVL